MDTKNSQGQILIETCLFMFFVLLVFCIGYSKFQTTAKSRTSKNHQGYKSYENIKHRNHGFQFSQDVVR